MKAGRCVCSRSMDCGWRRCGYRHVSHANQWRAPRKDTDDATILRLYGDILAGLRPHCEACRGVKGRDPSEIAHPPGEEIWKAY